MKTSAATTPSTPSARSGPTLLATPQTPAVDLNSSLREWAAMIGLLVVAFLPVLKWMYERWNAADSYTSHGFLVPFIVAYLVYSKREILAHEPRRPAKSGLIIFGIGLLLFVVSGLLRVYFTSGFAMVICLAGMLVYWGGWNWAKHLWFALFFLTFMLPLPELAIARTNLFLKLLVTKSAVLLCEMFGIPVVMEGAKLQLERGDLVVGDVCSGLRSLSALIALGVLYAYFYGRKNRWVQFTLLAAVVPIALGANMLRIFVNILFVNWFGKELLFRPLMTTSFTGVVDLHLISGFVVFVAALGGLYLTMRFTEVMTEKAPAEEVPA